MTDMTLVHPTNVYLISKTPVGTEWRTVGKRSGKRDLISTNPTLYTRSFINVNVQEIVIFLFYRGR